jgi:hypothetical protein
LAYINGNDVRRRRLTSQKESEIQLMKMKCRYLGLIILKSMEGQR